MLKKCLLRYGQRPDKILGLTPTINHDMEILLQGRLLLIEHEGTKIVYSASEAYIRRLAAALLEGIT